MARFKELYPTVPVNMVYELPNFKVMVGYFLTSEEALVLWGKIKGEFDGRWLFVPILHWMTWKRARYRRSNFWMTDRLRQKRRENRALRNTQCEVFLLEMKFFLKKCKKRYNS